MKCETTNITSLHGPYGLTVDTGTKPRRESFDMAEELYQYALLA
jgi:hypothetical protein